MFQSIIKFSYGFIVTYLITYEKCFFRFLSYTSHAQSEKAYLFRAGFFQTCRCGFHSASCGINIVYQQNRQTIQSSLRLKSLPQIFPSLRGIQLFLGTCAPDFSQRAFRYWYIQKHPQSFRQKSRLIESSHPQFPPVKRNGYDNVRLPSQNIPAAIAVHGKGVVIRILSAAVIFIPDQRFFHFLVVEKDSSAFVKAPPPSRAFPAVLLFRLYRTSALQAVVLRYRLEYAFAFRADQIFLIPQYPVAYRTAPGIKNIQRCLENFRRFFIFFQTTSFLPDESLPCRRFSLRISGRQVILSLP